MQYLSRYGLHIIDIFPKKLSGLSAVYWSNFFRELAKALVGLFIPIYLYELYGRIDEVLILYFFNYFLAILLIFPIVRIIQKKGFRTSVLISNLFYAAFYFSLALLKYDQLYFYSAILFGSFVTPMYWLSIHSIFILDDKESEIGREVGIRNIFQKTGSIVAPFTGALIITFFGFNTLYAIGTALLVVSSLPLFAMPYHERQRVSKASDLMKTFFSKKFRRYIFAYFGQAVDEQMFAVVWRIYFFLVVGTVEAFGAIRSFVSVISTITTYISGKLADKIGHKKLLGIGILTNSSLWFVRPLVRGIKSAFLLESLDSVQGAIYAVPRISAMYARSEYSGRSPLEFFFLREFSLNFGRTFALGFALILFKIGFSFGAIFVFTGFANLLVLLLTKKP